MDTIFCSNCGYKVSKDSKFCSNCGVVIQKDFEDNKEGNIEFLDDNSLTKISSLVSKTTESLQKNNNIKN